MQETGYVRMTISCSSQRPSTMNNLVMIQMYCSSLHDIAPDKAMVKWYCATRKHTMESIRSRRSTKHLRLRCCLSITSMYNHTQCVEAREPLLLLLSDRSIKPSFFKYFIRLNELINKVIYFYRLHPAVFFNMVDVRTDYTALV
jgi:hypothetical protein